MSSDVQSGRGPQTRRAGAAASSRPSDDEADVAAEVAVDLGHVSDAQSTNVEARNARKPKKRLRRRKDKPDASAPAEPVKSRSLSSLTPRFDPDQHGTYLRRLKEVVKDPRNLNIALTGRYGAGKSSVLDEFQAEYPRATQRLSISTLAPDTDTDDTTAEARTDTTNRIQKEVVKHLLYGAPRRIGRSSRFSRIAVLSLPWAFMQAAMAVAAIGALLYVFGWLPDIKWTGKSQPVWVRASAWLGTALVVTLMGTVVRVLTHGRFVSDVKAAGAAVTLAEKPQTFFDKYLDEIIHYFDYGSKDIVVFEDLDRFEDPKIFEALRELNTLLNDTPRRRARRRGRLPCRALGQVLRWVRLYDRLDEKLSDRWAAVILGRGVPLRFVYAVKDSLFERLGAETVQAVDAGDAAAGETLRANRTKFFDVVVPLVPFISHRNARELLIDLLDEVGITGIEKKLINIVAQHSTDMRLMRNICNEYLVFEERLLRSDRVAPGLDPSRLFALVAYKNFHLGDFERISRRESDLDRLYGFHQDLVRASIEMLEAKNRRLLVQKGAAPTRDKAAQMLGKRLNRYAEAMGQALAQQGWRQLYFKTAADTHSLADTAGHQFWAAVATTHHLEILCSPDAARSRSTSVITLNAEDLAVMFPEALQADRWVKLDEQATRVQLLRNERDIRALRSADFTHLAQLGQFTLAVSDGIQPVHSTNQGDTEKDAAPLVNRTFADLVAATMKSPLARDLVLRGYIDRNFSLYAAQFYGHFTGPDVATFMVQHVQTNTMNIDYDLSRPGAVANLLDEIEEAGEDLTGTVVAYNINIVDHLLKTDHIKAGGVIERLVVDYDDEETRTFLSAYFTAGAHRQQLAARLAAHPWPRVFIYLGASDEIPDDVRPALVSAALVAADAPELYDLPDEFGDFLQANFGNMTAFTQPQGEESTGTILSVLERMGIQLSQLKPLAAELRSGVIARRAYELNVDNLVEALGTKQISLDDIRALDLVYRYCIDEFDTYLDACGVHRPTQWAVSTPETLTNVMNDLSGVYEEETFVRFSHDVAQRTEPSVRVTSLKDVPAPSWPALAEQRLFEPTLENVHRYRAGVGKVDASLAKLLTVANTIDISAGTEGYDVDAEAIAILNASAIDDAAKRVALAESLHPSKPLPVDQIASRATGLFAPLLAAGLVEDSAASFAHFRGCGWASIGPAIEVSDDIVSFISPDIVEGMVGDLLDDATTRRKLGAKVMANPDSYAPDSDPVALRAVARYARGMSVSLSPETVLRVARAQPIESTLVLSLLRGAVPAAEARVIVEVFAALGGDYAKVTVPGATFGLPHDEVHGDLLQTLKSAGLVDFRKKINRPRYAVTVI
ncbi:MAG: hypothetical protein M3306_05430 [Actinomycetota bacterium]|nr:hypothetical protein [Actinomycetota bacterium]